MGADHREVLTMKRWTAGLSVVLLIAMMAGAGYLGLQSVQGKDTPGTEAPSTVEVTRGDVQTTVTAPGHLAYTHETVLSFAVAGKLAEVYVQPGLRVPAGQVLAQLDTAPLDEKVRAAHADLEVAQAGVDQLQAAPSAAAWAAAQLALARAGAQLRALTAGPSAAEIATAEAEVAAARNQLAALRALPGPAALAQAQAQLDRATATLQQAQTAYDRVRDRPDVGMLPQALALQQATIDCEAAQAGLDAARQGATPAAFEAAQARLAAARATLHQLETGPSADELALAELQVELARAELVQLVAGPSAADLRRAEATVQLAELSLAKALAGLEAATLVAPFAGTVLEVHAGPGETVAPGTGLILLADSYGLEVEATVIEEDLPLVQTGQKVELFFDAQPEAQVLGSVARIVPQRLPGDRPLYIVCITSAELPDGLVAGMTADASIVVDSREDVLRLPRALVRARSDGTATVQVWTGSEVEERAVQVGLRGDLYIELLSGIVQGEEVVAQ
jgi:HlyD family secretion protein